MRAQPLILFSSFLLISSALEHHELNCSSNTNNSHFIWKVSSKRSKVPSYLFGTIHISYKEIWNQVPSVVKQVFNSSRNVVFELELQKEETFRRLARCKNLPNLERLHQHISREIYDRLKRYLKEFRSYVHQWFVRHSARARAAREQARRFYKSIVGDWDRKKPIWILFTLYRLEHPFDEIDNAAMLDVHLAQIARRSEKRVFALETPEEQCDPLSSVSNEDVEFAVSYVLSYLESVNAERLLTLRHVKKSSSMSKNTLRLIQSYKCGSIESSLADATSGHIVGFGLRQEDERRAKEIDAKLRNDIISNRNVRMAERIQSYIEKNQQKSFFFAVGTGHFFGKDNIIELLQIKGYTVTPVGQDDLNVITTEVPEVRKFNSLWVRTITGAPPIDQVESSSSFRVPSFVIFIGSFLSWSISL
ncbi:hypothetical protein L596_003481 [Steinernema carpocapsae]|uniref:Metalloprotease TIKI homolog n=1 Tax=Steinernema carpocapsae TaxID=34508 RepID=A0A4U8USV3_STECR|nr:hypothetical protein L596_003481 [Steinernema carpocapsae]